VQVFKKTFNLLVRPYIILLLILLMLFISPWINKDRPLDYLQQVITNLEPETIYKYSLTMEFNSEDYVKVSTYLPMEDARQENLEEVISAKGLEIEDRIIKDSRFIKFYGKSLTQQIYYSALLSLRAVEYDISSEIKIPRYYENDLSNYLDSTDVIPVNHPEIIAQWNKIKPSNERNMLQVLNAIYNYTYNDIETLPFKGLTDSLTALRLGVASCNGKSRLFLSLARLNNIPTRLVGGVILNGKKKKTSHQWVEVFIQDTWVPFDVTNGHFASLPEKYVGLYRGDYYLFKHTPNIKFDYYFTSSRKTIAPAVYRDIVINNELLPNASQMLQDLGIPIKASLIFLLFPLSTLLIAFLRNIVGLKTFSIFMPMLVAAALMYTGFWAGLIGLSFVLALAVVSHHILGKFHILKIPRLAAVVTIISITVLYGIVFVEIPMGVEIGILALFPVIILSFTADNIHEMSSESDWRGLLHSGIGTLVSIVLCYVIFNSILLQGLFSLYPELLFVILLALLYIGSWSGMRVIETFRFWSLLGRLDSRVLAMNDRNINLVNKRNDKNLMKLAIDKLQTKKALEAKNIPHPKTLARCRNHAEIEPFLKVIEKHNEFVLKPNKGSGGGGILILEKDPSNEGFITKSGRHYSVDNLRKHIGEILYGHFAQDGEEDEVFVEPLIKQHHSLAKFAPLGLCDIRVIIVNGQLISAMLRVPTASSDGKANLHQGSIGVAINMDTGKVERASLKGIEITHHPDLNVEFKDIKIPFWEQIREIAKNCYIAIPLGFMGTDICLDEDFGPLVLEVNGRPGLEIQNVQDYGMKVPIYEAF
jgi:alpha-L-glutamate ligase-like protein